MGQNSGHRYIGRRRDNCLGLTIALYTYFGQLHALLQNAQSNSEALNSRIDTDFRQYRPAAAKII